MQIVPHSPLPYDPADEELEKGEAETNQALNHEMRQIQETVLENSGHAERSVHAKAFGLIQGELRVFDDLDPHLAQGIFQPGKRYRALGRMSAIPGDIVPDEITLPRGFSLKVFEVEGERLEGSEGETVQDFILINGPRFIMPTAKAFLQNLRMLEKTTDRVEGLKKGVSTMNRAIEGVLEAFGGESVLLKGMGGAPMTHPLGDTYFSQTAFRYGAYVAKFALAPATDAMRALKDEKVDIKGRPDGYRELVVDHLRQQGGEWTLMVQLRTRREMQIEDASKEWDQDDSPYLPVARFVAAPQSVWSGDASQQVDDRLSYLIWRGVEAHKPLGRVNRVRKDAYVDAAAFRRQANGCPMHEPRSWDETVGQIRAG